MDVESSLSVVGKVGFHSNTLCDFALLLFSHLFCHVTFLLRVYFSDFFRRKYCNIFHEEIIFVSLCMLFWRGRCVLGGGGICISKLDGMIDNTSMS